MRFPPAVLERFAQTLPGKLVLVPHDQSELPIGAIYRAAVRPAAPSTSRCGSPAAREPSPNQVRSSGSRAAAACS
jgi:hypothetical protein